MRSLPPPTRSNLKWASSIQKNTKSYFKVFHKIPIFTKSSNKKRGILI